MNNKEKVLEGIKNLKTILEEELEGSRPRSCALTDLDGIRHWVRDYFEEKETKE